MTKAPVFEQPMNERVRSFLRFQMLFARLDHHLSRASTWDSHAAISTLLEIVNLTTRSDIKSEVMKELDRQHSAFGLFADAPDVDERRLAAVMTHQKELIDQLHAQKGQISLLAANNEFLNMVKQRASVSGSTCGLDMPAYQHWLGTALDHRREAITRWIEPMQTVRDAVELILDAIRQSTPLIEAHAPNGFYEQTLNQNRPLQLISVTFRNAIGLFPEISAGKQRFTIRFMRQSSPEKRAEQTTEEVVFLLACCSI